MRAFRSGMSPFRAGVIALDVESFRLERSKAFGATHTVHNAVADPVDAIRETTDGKLADVVVEAASDASSINLAIDLVRVAYGVERLGLQHHLRGDRIHQNAIGFYIHRNFCEVDIATGNRSFT